MRPRPSPTPTSPASRRRGRRCPTLVRRVVDDRCRGGAGQQQRRRDEPPPPPPSTATSSCTDLFNYLNDMVDGGLQPAARHRRARSTSTRRWPPSAPRWPWRRRPQPPHRGVPEGPARHQPAEQRRPASTWRASTWPVSTSTPRRCRAWRSQAGPRWRWRLPITNTTPPRSGGGLGLREVHQLHREPGLQQPPRARTCCLLESAVDDPELKATWGDTLSGQWLALGFTSSNGVDPRRQASPRPLHGVPGR